MSFFKVLDVALSGFISIINIYIKLWYITLPISIYIGIENMRFLAGEELLISKLRKWIKKKY